MSTREEIGELVQEGRHLIAGEWVPAQNGETIDVIDPSSGSVIGSVPSGTAEDVDAAVAAAAAAFPAWRDLSASVRTRLLYAWADLLDQHALDIDRIESFEIGRPSWGPSNIGQIVRYYAGQADKITGMTLPTESTDVLAAVVREPYGVCASITPWNVPAGLMTYSIAPALAAGNTVVAKPAGEAPLACLFVGDLAVKAGIPAGVVNIVTGSGSVAGSALAGHPGIDHMSFTGSPTTGTAIMKACADNHTPLNLELGGKSPSIVFADADLERAVPLIVQSITFNSGQICGAGSRLLVQRSIEKQVVEAVAQHMASLSLGPASSQPHMGPLISAKQRDTVLSYIETGVREGATVVHGGRAPEDAALVDGFYVEPTLITDVQPTDVIAQEEIFGPVLTVLPFDSEDEAIRIANGTEFGLAASVFTGDVSTAIRVSKRLVSGTVTVNAIGPFHGAIGSPHGGFRSSGFGRSHGIDAIDEYLQEKSIVINAVP